MLCKLLTVNNIKIKLMKIEFLSVNSDIFTTIYAKIAPNTNSCFFFELLRFNFVIQIKIV